MQCLSLVTKKNTASGLIHHERLKVDRREKHKQESRLMFLGTRNLFSALVFVSSVLCKDTMEELTLVRTSELTGLGMESGSKRFGGGGGPGGLP